MVRKARQHMYSQQGPWQARAEQCCKGSDRGSSDGAAATAIAASNAITAAGA